MKTPAPTPRRRAEGSGATRARRSPTSGSARGLQLIAYVRVSTERQAERYGPAAQRAAIRAWAKATGARIVRSWR